MFPPVPQKCFAVEPLENRRLLSAAPFVSNMSAAQAHAAHKAHLAHLAHLAHVRHVNHVRHLAQVRLQQAVAADVQNFLTMQPPTIPMFTSGTLGNPVAGALDSVTPIFTPPLISSAA
jgi:hypothetical protein